MLPGLAYEQFTPEAAERLNEFQVFRDDFDELKILYVDAFELSSRALAFIGSVLNLSLRADATKWADMQTRTLHRVRKMRAVDREFILDELPLAKTLYADIDRHTRNDIGHCSVYYDFASGDLVGEQGQRENIILFLEDLLGVARVTQYLMIFMAKISIDYEASAT